MSERQPDHDSSLITHHASLRLFVAVLAPPGVQAAVRAARQVLQPVAPGVRWNDPAGAHITLQFLGATPPERVEALTAALAAVAAAAAPLTLRTAGLGVFPSASRPRVVWLGLTGQHERLAMVQAAVVAATAPLGFVADARPFSPHLTLGRLRPEASPSEQAAVGRAVQAAAPPAPVEWRVEELALMESVLSRAGSTYRALGRWRLGG